ncbi:hypothetical protein [Sphaerisporangium perillae]|uniref:hypothetical protein n=1 Tax=Sphaerisporangium perillae TaxID=2935860 RepID=UPI00200DE67F|nr:hypothetical protein [Sphaerisporangium perillae]
MNAAARNGRPSRWCRWTSSGSAPRRWRSSPAPLRTSLDLPATIEAAVPDADLLGAGDGTAGPRMRADRA